MKRWIAAVIVCVVSSSVPVWAQDAPPDPPRVWVQNSPKLEMAGYALLVGGLVLIVPSGDTYHILGSDYCVKARSVDYGGCGRPPAVVKTAVALFGTGVAFIVIGHRSRRVVLAPTMVGLGGTATIRW